VSVLVTRAANSNGESNRVVPCSDRLRVMHSRPLATVRRRPA